MVDSQGGGKGVEPEEEGQEAPQHVLQPGRGWRVCVSGASVRLGGARAQVRPLPVLAGYSRPPSTLAPLAAARTDIMSPLVAGSKVPAASSTPQKPVPSQ